MQPQCPQLALLRLLISRAESAAHLLLSTWQRYMGRVHPGDRDLAPGPVIVGLIPETEEATHETGVKTTEEEMKSNINKDRS
ncbi:hypothetical protein HUJ05_011942 [Dendroctonus ponderosae]|nr:hypothetical protein HUJ05_011942 [Dendroctonus ponderosae]